MKTQLKPGKHDVRLLYGGGPQPVDLQNRSRIIPLPAHGAEDVIAASADSREVICGTNDGSLYLVNIDTNACSLIANTGGRPLGLELCKDGSLIVCDSFAGLLKYRRVSSGNDSESPDGSIWFTESTSRFHYPEFMGAILEHAPRGSLNVWRPNGEVKRVLYGRYFANGVVAEPNGDGVLFCETTDYAVRRWHIPSQSVTDLAENLPGFPDNASALTPTGRDGLSEIWITYAHTRSLPLDLLAKFPGIIRHIAWNLPDAIRPGPGHEVWAAQWLYDDVIGWRHAQCTPRHTKLLHNRDHVCALARKYPPAAA